MNERMKCMGRAGLVSLLVGSSTLALAAPAQRALDQAPPFRQAGVQGITSVTATEYEIVPGAEAALALDCPPAFGIAPLVVQFRTVYRQLDGVCGAPGLPACGGRLTQLREVCFEPASGPSPEFSVGAIDAAAPAGSSLVRICHDPMGFADCTGVNPAATIVAAGETSLHGLDVMLPGPDGRVTRHAAVDTLGFEIDDFDGGPVTVRGGPQTLSSHFERIGLDRCGFRGIADLFGIPNAPGSERACGSVATTMGPLAQ